MDSAASSGWIKFWRTYFYARDAAQEAQPVYFCQRCNDEGAKKRSGDPIGRFRYGAKTVKFSDGRVARYLQCGHHIDQQQRPELRAA